MNPSSNDLQSIMQPISRNWKVALGIWIAILVLTGIKAYRTEKYFRLTFFITSDYLISDVIQGKDNLTVTKSIPTLNQVEIKALTANYQSLTKPEHPSLRKITLLPSRTPRENNACEVSLEVFNTDQVSVIIDGYVAYLNRNPYFMQKVEQERNYYQGLLKEMDAWLDPSGRTGFGADEKASPGFRMTIENREVVRLKLKSIQGFQVSVPPVIPGQYVNMPVWKQMILAMVWGAIVALLAAFLMGVIRPTKH